MKIGKNCRKIDNTWKTMKDFQDYPLSWRERTSRDEVQVYPLTWAGNSGLSLNLSGKV